MNLKRHHKFYLTKTFFHNNSLPSFKKTHPRMRREGRQRGMVRTYPILSEPLNHPRRNQRSLNELASPPVAGIFTKVPSKPTNHSKFTRKCGRSKCYGCHIHLVTKSRDKVKGTQKMRSSSDIVSNYRLITWRVVDSSPGFKILGFSATGVLDYLDHVDDYDYDYEGKDSDHEHDDVDFNESYDYEMASYDHEMRSHGVEIEEIDGCDDVDVDVDDETNDDDDDDDDRMSFCEVGFAWEAVEEDESWCLVEEI